MATNDQDRESGSVEPPVAGDEIATLLGYLERQRATFAWKTGGLDAAGLRATHAPSAMTLGGMVLHMTRFEDDMSTEWLRAQPQAAPWNAVDWDAEPYWDWTQGTGIPPDRLYAGWRDAVASARTLFAIAIADGGPERQAALPVGADREMPSLRYILLNMIEEYARHNGHADLIRESIDGLTGHDPPR